jgi:hypothetical protein
VDPVIALLYNAADLAVANLGSIIDFERAPRHKAARVDREYHGLKEFLVSAIERTVDENAVFCPLAPSPSGLSH